MATQVERNRNYRNRMRSRLTELEAQIAAMGCNITSMETRNITPHNITALETENAELKAKVVKLTKGLADAMEKLKTKDNRIAELEAEVENLRSMGGHGEEAAEDDTYVDTDGCVRTRNWS